VEGRECFNWILVSEYSLPWHVFCQRMDNSWDNFYPVLDVLSTEGRESSTADQGVQDVGRKQYVDAAYWDFYVINHLIPGRIVQSDPNE
jgi:hypothetical protein